LGPLKQKVRGPRPPGSPGSDAYAHIIVEVAKALGGSFKLATIAPKTKGDDSTAQGNTKEWGYKQIKKDK